MEGQTTFSVQWIQYKLPVERSLESSAFRKLIKPLISNTNFQTTHAQVVITTLSSSFKLRLLPPPTLSSYPTQQPFLTWNTFPLPRLFSFPMLISRGQRFCPPQQCSYTTLLGHIFRLHRATWYTYLWVKSSWLWSPSNVPLQVCFPFSAIQ